MSRGNQARDQRSIDLDGIGLDRVDRSNGRFFDHTGGVAPDRTAFRSLESVGHLWSGLKLPPHALTALNLPQMDELGLPSSYKIGQLAQTAIGASGLTAALIWSIRNGSTDIPTVTVPLRHACAEFKSERLFAVNGKREEDTFGTIGGLHKTSDGYTTERADVSKQTKKWASMELEREAFRHGLVIAALRSYRQWDALPRAEAITTFPILLKRLRKGPEGLPQQIRSLSSRCLGGLWVVELSRVIAAPLAGRTLAAHGADALWVTSPKLPNLPALDRDLARGKRTIHCDLNNPSDKRRLLELVKTANVFIQGYRPGALEAQGLGVDELLAINPDLIYANMSAYGPAGPWAMNRGFDSIVQTCSGMNISEAEHAGQDEPARPTPCQALDHAGGYFLATGIMAALYHKAIAGGSYQVDISLAAVMKYLRSLGQYEGATGFQCPDIAQPEDVEEFMETKPSGFGDLKAIKHSARIEGCSVGWDIMPQPLGSDRAEWL